MKLFALVLAALVAVAFGSTDVNSVVATMEPSSWDDGQTWYWCMGVGGDQPIDKVFVPNQSVTASLRITLSAPSDNVGLMLSTHGEYSNVIFSKDKSDTWVVTLRDGLTDKNDFSLAMLMDGTLSGSVLIENDADVRVLEVQFEMTSATPLRSADISDPAYQCDDSGSSVDTPTGTSSHAAAANHLFALVVICSVLVVVPFSCVVYKSRRHVKRQRKCRQRSSQPQQLNVMQPASVGSDLMVPAVVEMPDGSERMQYVRLDSVLYNPNAATSRV